MVSEQRLLSKLEHTPKRVLLRRYPDTENKTNISPNAPCEKKEKRKKFSILVQSIIQWKEVELPLTKTL
jgi:hypothetical protein